MLPAGPQTHQKVGTGKQDIEAVHVLHDPAVSNLVVTKVFLHYEEGMLHLAADSRFPMLIFLVPVDSMKGVFHPETGRAKVDPEIDLRKTLFLTNRIDTLRSAKVAGVPVHDLVIIPEQIWCLGYMV